MKRLWEWLQRRRERAALEHQQAVYVALIAKWERKYWWRFVPPEGWQIGFNTSYLPVEALLQIEQHGQIKPVALVEIHNATGVPIPFIRNYYQR